MAQNFIANLLRRNKNEEELPYITPTQLDESGNIDPVKSANLELRLKQASTPLTLGERFFGRDMEQDYQTINPQTKEVEMATLTNHKPGFFEDFSRGYRENATQDFNVNNLAPVENKGLATRLGEGLGTIERFANSPLGRGLIAYGLSNSMGDTNPLEQAFTAGVGRQNNITRDKAYRQGLINMGVDEAQINAIPGIMSDDVYKNMIDALNAQEMRKYRELYLTNQQEQNKMMNQYRQDQLKYQQMQDAYDRAQKNREFDYRASQDAINNEFKRRGLDIRANQQNAYDKKIRGNIQTNKALVQKIDTLIKDIENPANKGATGLIVGSLAKNPGDWQKALVNNRSTQGQLGVRGGISDIRSATLVDRTGTAQTATEIANLAPYLPDVTDSAKVAADKLRNMKKYILQETNLYEKNYSDSNINNDNDNGGWAF